MHFPRRFDWDRQKAAENARKHGVTFDHAATAFDDPDHLLTYDDEHSLSEDRYLLLGMSESTGLLLVVHVQRGRKTRLISARRATPRETLTYAQSLIKKARGENR